MLKIVSGMEVRVGLVCMKGPPLNAYLVLRYSMFGQALIIIIHLPLQRRFHNCRFMSMSILIINIESEQLQRNECPCFITLGLSFSDQPPKVSPETLGAILSSLLCLGPSIFYTQTRNHKNINANYSIQIQMKKEYLAFLLVFKSFLELLPYSPTVATRRKD